MTDVRKITPEEIAAAVSEMNRELKAVGESAIDRIDCSPENIEQGLARLVLSLIELLRRLLERQAIRRMEGGSLDDTKVEEMGQALMRLEAKINEIAGAFGLKPEDLNLELGPLGNLLDKQGQGAQPLAGGPHKTWSCDQTTNFLEASISKIRAGSSPLPACT